MELIILVIFIVAGGVCIGGGVHFIPVGGAPAAMSTATGVGTGTAMLAAGAGLTGLITAASMTGQAWYLVALAGAVGAMLMMGITMLIANFVYIFGVGIVPASSKASVDPITKLDQDPYKTPGTEGHGVPTVCFVSGIIGALLGGAGGGLVYYAVDSLASASTVLSGVDATAAAGLAAIVSVGIFFINSVAASYNIGGTIEGFHDPKFKKIPRGFAACIIASAILGVIVVLLMGGF